MTMAMAITPPPLMLMKILPPRVRITTVGITLTVAGINQGVVPIPQRIGVMIIPICSLYTLLYNPVK